MTRNALTQIGSCVVIIAGLLSPAVGQAQQGAGGALSPAKSNCDSKTGCANYSTGNVTSQNPMQQRTSNSPYDQGGQELSPGKSNCDSKSGCASYPTGNPTKDNPVPQK